MTKELVKNRALELFIMLSIHSARLILFLKITVVHLLPSMRVEFVRHGPARPPAHLREHANGRGIRQGARPVRQIRHALLPLLVSPV